MSERVRIILEMDLDQAQAGCLETMAPLVGLVIREELGIKPVRTIVTRVGGEVVSRDGG